MSVLYPPSQRAFTFTELLMVVTIIAVLIALLIPVVKLVRIAAKERVCLSNAGQLTLAFLAYAHENDGRVDSRSSGHIGTLTDWTGPVSKAGFIENRRIYFCPTALTTAGTSYADEWMNYPGAKNAEVYNYVDTGVACYGAHLRTYSAPGANTDPNGPRGSTGISQGSIDRLSQAKSWDCMLMERCYWASVTASVPKLSHCNDSISKPRMLAVSWFDGAVTRCPTDKLAGTTGFLPDPYYTR
jgi:prepilin-type N-terminal cleavage/methylation domain-containing protein